MKNMSALAWVGCPRVVLFGLEPVLIPSYLLPPLAEGRPTLPEKNTALLGTRGSWPYY